MWHFGVMIRKQFNFLVQFPDIQYFVWDEKALCNQTMISLPDVFDIVAHVNPCYALFSLISALQEITQTLWIVDELKSFVYTTCQPLMNCPLLKVFLAVGIHFSDHCLCGEAAAGDGNIRLNVWTACRDKKPSSDHCREELHSGKIDTLCKKTH